MIDENNQNKDEVQRLLNQEVPYWQGLSESSFWREFAAKKQAKISLLSLMTILFSIVYLIFAKKGETNQLLFLLCFLLTVSTSIILDFLNFLQLYRLKIQLEIIQQAQKQLKDSN